MSCLVSTILLITLSAINITLPSVRQVERDELKVKLTPVNLRGMPVRINKAEASENIASFDIEYSITNSGTEPVLAVYFRLFTADSTGKIIDVSDTSSGEKIDVGLTRVDRSDITGELKKSNTYLIAVNRVITPSGVWFVNQDSDLASAVKAKLIKQSKENPAVTFEPNTTTTEADRVEIFELILRDILRDKKKSEMLRDPSKLILLRESVSFNLPDNLPARLVTMDKEEIQTLADVEGRIAYLIYEPLTSEGSQVGATIQLRSSYLPQPPKPFRLTSGYDFSFVCVKENGRWIIRSFDGIALSVAGLLPAHD
jgi:hypothetical protein